MLIPELLRILCCPKCRADVRYDPSSETLTCVSCGQQYPVKDGIPIMLPDDEGGSPPKP
ncbi:MAG TPA: Trm112 family protein [Bacteroidota bacterium]